jgi:DNA-binding transcriptional ArsR family regulator
MSEKYILFDLEDEKSKKLGEVLGSSACKKIVNLLAERELSISDISKELGMPINSVQYNIGKLKDSGLIEESRHFWSVKGKKMPIYKVVNKSIVISPMKNSSKLKSILPVVAISGILTGVLAFLYKSKSFIIEKAAETSSDFNQLISTGSSANANLANKSIGYSSSFIATSPWIWFALGAGVVLLAFVLWNYKKL